MTTEVNTTTTVADHLLNDTTIICANEGCNEPLDARQVDYFTNGPGATRPQSDRTCRDCYRAQKSNISRSDSKAETTSPNKGKKDNKKNKGAARREDDRRAKEDNRRPSNVRKERVQFSRHTQELTSALRQDNEARSELVNAAVNTINSVPVWQRKRLLDEMTRRYNTDLEQLKL